MKPITQVRRERLRELVDEAGTQVAVALRIGKDKNHIHQWLLPPEAKGARNIGSKSARIIERAFVRPDGWMDSDPQSFSRADEQSPSDYRHSRAARPTAAILAEAVGVIEADEAVNGTYPPLKHAELLLELCDRIAAGESAMVLLAKVTKERQQGDRNGTGKAAAAE